MAIKTIRVFAEYTSDGYVPMPSQGNIDYGITLGSTFPETQPSSFQTDDPNIDVAVTTMTDYYVWIRTHGTSWNPFYTRVVRIYPDSPSINSVVMNMIVAVGGGGTSIGGGSGVSYYLNGGTNQGILDGSTYYEMSKVPVEGTGVNFFKINTAGFENVAQFVTDAGDPGLLNIPAGNWPLGFYFSASDNSGAPKFYAEIYKYSAAGVFTLLASNSSNPEIITNGQAVDFYIANVAMPETALLVTDRIAIRIFINTDGNRTITLHTQDSTLSTVGTTFTRGITAINGLIKQVQYFAIGNSGSDAAIVSSDDTHTINLPTASATKRGLLSGTDWATFNAKQPALSGDGFVKISGSTISYDNNTYLTPLDAASVYQRLDKMVSNLLPSNTEYPNSNAVLAKLALKANIENPSFTGSMNIVGIESRINFYDENNAIKYFIGYDSGFLRIFQNAGSASRFYINSDGKTFIPGILEVGSVIKSGGTASQFLKADGSVDGATYATSSSLSSYLLSSVAATTYQRIDKMVSNLLASDTEYPNSNAVLAKLALKADAANPNFTGSMNITGIESRINFYDENNARKYFIGYDGGTLRIYQDAGSASRYYINPSGKTFIPGDLEVGTVSKSGGTASQFLKADGSVDSSTYVTSASLSSYLLSSTAASTYQRLDKMVSNLLASSTEYPNSNAVLAALALKANAANPTFTGDFTISGATPRLYFVDTDNNPDYTLFADAGYFYIYDQTVGATRFSINSSGNINSGVGKSITAGSFVKESGTSSQFLMADGSVSTGPSLSGYVPYTGATTNVNLGTNSITAISYDRSSAGKGYLNGKYDGIETTITTGPIYCLSESYAPTSTSLNTMYGIGYSYNNFTGAYGPTNTWGMYVAGGGNAGIFLTENGFGYFKGKILINTITDAGYTLDVNGTGRFTGALSGTSATLSILSSGTPLRIDVFNGNNITSNTKFAIGTGGQYGTITNKKFLDIDFNGYNNYTQARIRSWDENGSTGYGNLYFYTNGTAGTDATTLAMAMNYNGSIGLGGTYFNTRLNVNIISGATDGISLIDNNANTPAGFTYSTTTGENRIGGLLSYVFTTLYSGGYECIRITTGGKVGIGTNNPVNAKLVISSTDSNKISIDGGSSQNGMRWESVSTANTFYLFNGAISSSGWGLYNITTATFPFWVTNGGNVILGTTTDNGNKLQVSGTTTATSYARSSAGTGYLNGKYSGVENTNTTGPIYCLGDSYVPTSTSTGSMYGIGYSYNSFTGAYGPANDWGMYVVGGGTVGVYLSAGGNGYFRGSVTATAFFESSDMRLKTIINDNPIIHEIEHLQAKLYEKNGKIELGYFAQDAEKIMPYAVTKNEDGFLNLSYREIHTAKIARLEKEVEMLKAQLNVA